MCGICGKINFEAQESVPEAIIARMCEKMAHRGPNAQGIYAKGPVGLGHRRLSIVDLSPLGRQPMTTSDGRLTIVFNGEIYNYQALRTHLIAHGYQFRSDTDTEVLLYLYEQEGAACLPKLRGMFAFCIWDKLNASLFLARDRLGKKPLFYHAGKSSLTFASELACLLENPEITPQPDLVAIHHYLTYQYVPAPLTAFQGIANLPPAHYLVCQGGQSQLHRYWELDYLPKVPATTSQEIQALRDELLEKITECVQLRMSNEVPMGVFLSGGVDSSAIVAIMAGILRRPVKTFSIGFENSAFNELPYARIVAKKFQTDHFEAIVKPDVVSLLPTLALRYGNPFADSSAIPTYYVSQLARQHVTVALNGDGGDESFAGYERYLALQYLQKCQKILRLPGLAQTIQVVQAACRVAARGTGAWNPWLWRLTRFLEQLPKNLAHAYLGWMCHWDAPMKSNLYQPDFARQMAAHDSAALLVAQFTHAKSDNLLEAAMFSDIMMYLPGDLLVKMDTASMAHGLEVRSPFLDHTLIEFAAKMPFALKLHSSNGKFLLKQALRQLLPAAILYRSKKGFGVPLASWLRHELKPMAYDLLLSPNAWGRQYFQIAYIEQLLQQHSSGKWNWHYPLWNLMMLELWHRTFWK